MNSSEAWSQVATSSFVSLGTFRKTGQVVETPVWIARDGDDLVVTTVRTTGKVKRLRRDPHVTLQPCTRRGKVTPGSVQVIARGLIVENDERAAAALAEKYGFQFRLILGIERLAQAIRRRESQRVTIRISTP